MPPVSKDQRVRFSIPALPTVAEGREVERGLEDALVQQVVALDAVEGTGHESVDTAEGKHLINQQTEGLSLLQSRLGDGLEARVGAASPDGVGANTLNRIIEVRRERQKLRRGEVPEYEGVSKNPGTTPEILRILHKRRAKQAKKHANEIAENPKYAPDVSNDSLAIHGWLQTPEARARTLVDSILQFRASWRSLEHMDRTEGPRDTSQGKLASSGIVGLNELRLAAQEIPLGRSFSDKRERALTRLAVVNHPQSSVSKIFYARNLVAELGERLEGAINTAYVGTGRFAVSVYGAIHQEYSADSPAVVDEFFRTKVFSGGAKEDRVAILQGLVSAAKDPAHAARHLDRLRERFAYVVPFSAEALAGDALRDAILEHLGAHTEISNLARMEPSERLETYALLVDFYDTLGELDANAETLEAQCFYGKEASTQTARLIKSIRDGSSDTVLESSGLARQALASALRKTTSGFDRHMLWRLDREVEQLAAAEMGLAMKNIRDPEATVEDLGRGVLAMRSGLRGLQASGFEHLRSGGRPRDVASFAQLEKRATKLLDEMDAGEATVEDIRGFMREAHASANEVANSIQIYFKRRERANLFSRVPVGLDPDFADNLIKETPLHYMLGIARAGRAFGIPRTVSDRRLTLGEGVEVINSVGRAGYKRILVADSLEDLLRFEPTMDDFAIVRHIDEKDKAMVVVGGLAIDKSETPPGFSHLSVLAKGQDMGAVAFPNLAEEYMPFFESVANSSPVLERRLFIDDSDGDLVAMPMEDAVREGLVDPEVTEPEAIEERHLEPLRSGANYEHRYYECIEGVRRLVDEHFIHRSATRKTKRIDVPLPDLTNEHGLPPIPTLDEVGQLTSTDDMIQTAGSKGAVLAFMRTLPELEEIGVEVPGGSVIPPYYVADLLRKIPDAERTLFDTWLEAYGAPVDSKTADLLQTQFYNDVDHRQATVEALKARVTEGLEELLISGNKATPEGKLLLEHLARSEDLMPSPRSKVPWIGRSAQTLEDLLNKNAPGQHESAGNLKTVVERLSGFVEVIASHWATVAIENNVQGQFNLQKDWPAVVVERFVKATVSGVAVSRGKRGELGMIGYQVVRGGKGGVDAVRSREEGYLGEHSQEPDRLADGASKSLLTMQQRWQLWKATQIIEKALNEAFAPDAEEPLAVDVEWAFVKGKLKIYQARFATGY